MEEIEYINVFSNERISRIKQKTLATQGEVVAGLVLPSELPMMLGTVAQDVLHILRWPEYDEFCQLHQLLANARLARHWTKLINLSKDENSEEPKYMVRMAEAHYITKEKSGSALVWGFLAWALYSADLTNQQDFIRQRGKVRYLYDVGKVLRCV